jgi:phosphoribosylaminoimidazole (AIR) synthetase
MEEMSKANLPTSFGVFSPTGHVVVAFENETIAKNARQALITGGITSDKITLYRGDEVLSEIENSRKTDNKLFQLGQEEEKVKRYDELARRGCGFLVVYAPKDKETEQVMSILHPFKPKFAEKYNLLTLQELA